MNYDHAITVREEIAKYCEFSQYEMELWFKHAFNATDADMVARELPFVVRNGAPYFWSEEMMNTCLECATTLPKDASFREEDLPTEDGFFASYHMTRLILDLKDDQHESHLIIGYSWFRLANRTLFIVWLADEAHNNTPYPIIFTNQTGTPVISIDTIVVSQVAARIIYGAFMLFCTMILFMKQKVVVPVKQLLDRPTRRRLKQKDASVHVVYLRKRDTQHTQDHDTHKHIEWDHQWVVRGHWRNQYYRSTKENRPLWINPHVKGPDDKPLVHSEKLFAVVR